MRLLPLMLMLACSPAPFDPFADGVSPPPSQAVSQPVPELTITAASSVVVGESLTVTMTGNLAVGEVVYLGHSRTVSRGGFCPSALGSNCLALDPPVRLLGTATVVQTGTAQLTLNIPASAPGGASAWLQAAVIRGLGGQGSVISNPLSVTLDARVEGCTDPRATNFDPDANIDDGSCSAPAAMYDPDPLYGPPPGTPDTVPSGRYYDIVYVRAPRHGDQTNTRWPEVKDPIRAEPGTDLVLLHPDNTETVLVAGGNGAVVDPCVSFDGQWIYYSLFPDMRTSALNYQRRDAPRMGADIYKIPATGGTPIRLTHQEFTPNLAAADWAEDHLSTDGSKNSLRYGIMNLGACPLPGGKVVFTSSRNGFRPNKTFTYPNLQLFVMDEDGSNVEQIGHLNLGSAMHPQVLTDGRIMFSSYEAQGLRDQRLWGLWAMWPDGRHFEPLMSPFKGASAFHFQTQRSDGEIVVEQYYNQNNNGFGSFVSFPSWPPSEGAAFGSAFPNDPSNPSIQMGWFFNTLPHYERFAFSPWGLDEVTPFAHGRDDAASEIPSSGELAGKVTHPSGAPHNELLLTWSPGPANNLMRPVNTPRVDGGLYMLQGETVLYPDDLVLIKNDPNYNEQQPRAVVPYHDIYGMDEPFELTWVPNDGSRHADLPAGTPFGIVGSSSMLRRDTFPGKGEAAFDGLDAFNTSQNDASSNWFTQGADAGLYDDDDIYAVRILSMEPTTHRSYGPGENSLKESFGSHARERLRILGEIPVRKRDADGNPVVLADGTVDTSFLARIPADVPFTFQTLDERGMALNTSQTWHQLRPGEVRNSCGGCHAHAQEPLPFEETAAGAPGFDVADLTEVTPLLTVDAQGEPTVRTEPVSAVDVEYTRDIKPILEASCVSCHSGGSPAAELDLSDTALIDGFEGTWHRLANDPSANWGRPPVIPAGVWRQTNASRYIRKFQSRRSLLAWVVFGERLDGWTDADHPTETVPGDASTLPPGANYNHADLDYGGRVMPPVGSGVPPLSEDDKRMIARWIDLGAPINSQRVPDDQYGWFLDDLRPTLALSWPRAGAHAAPLDEIRIGAFDYYSGLDLASLSVVADIEVAGHPAGTELAGLFTEEEPWVWTMPVQPPLSGVSGTLTVAIFDQEGNRTEVVRSFSTP